MDDYLAHAASVFMAFFAIMNPLANTPVFLGLTADDGPTVRRAVARKALLLAFVVVLVFCALGKLVFEMFGISIDAFRITGGGLVILVGYHMLQGKHSSLQHPTHGAQKDQDAALEVAISPLALPILAGPGTIATAMSFASTGGAPAFAITTGTFLLLCAITYVFFVGGERLVRLVGDSGINVVTRLMGLILAVIGTQMVIDGVYGAIRSFRG